MKSTTFEQTLNKTWSVPLNMVLKINLNIVIVLFNQVITYFNQLFNVAFVFKVFKVGPFLSLQDSYSRFASLLKIAARWGSALNNKKFYSQFCVIFNFCLVFV